MPHRVGHAVRCGLLALALLPVCGGGAGRTEEALVIAVPAPLTGPHARLGSPIHTAAGIVVGDANAGVGAGRPRFALDLRDDACASATTGAVAADIGRSPAVAVVGHPCAAGRKEAAQRYAAAGKLFVAAGPAGGGDLRGGDRHGFALTPAHASVGAFIGAEIVAGTRAASRVAVVRDRTALAIRLGGEVDAAVRGAGRTPVMVETFGGGDKDFSAIARRLSAADVTDVAIIAFPAEAGLALRDLAGALPGARFYGADMLATGEFVAVAGQTVAARMRIAMAATVAHLSARHTGVARLAARFEQTGTKLTREAVYAAVGIEAVLSAVAQAGTSEPGAVAVALRADGGHATMLGTVFFGADGRARLPTWSWSRWTGDRLLPDE